MSFIQYQYNINLKSSSLRTTIKFQSDMLFVLFKDYCIPSRVEKVQISNSFIIKKTYFYTRFPMICFGYFKRNWVGWNGKFPFLVKSRFFINIFSVRWGATAIWPPRIADMIPMDFLLQGYVKSVVYINI